MLRFRLTIHPSIHPPPPSVHFALFKNRLSAARCLLFRWCEKSCKVGVCLQLSSVVNYEPSLEIETGIGCLSPSREMLRKSFQNPPHFKAVLSVSYPISQCLKFPDYHPCVLRTEANLNVVFKSQWLINSNGRMALQNFALLVDKARFIINFTCWARFSHLRIGYMCQEDAQHFYQEYFSHTLNK